VKQTYWSAGEFNVGEDAKGKLGTGVGVRVDTETNGGGERLSNKSGEALK
jgi:hypothetical protein